MHGIALGLIVGAVIGAATMFGAFALAVAALRADREAREWIGPRPTLYAVPDQEQGA